MIDSDLQLGCALWVLLRSRYANPGLPLTSLRRPLDGFIAHRLHLVNARAINPFTVPGSRVLTSDSARCSLRRVEPLDSASLSTTLGFYSGLVVGHARCVMESRSPVDTRRLWRRVLSMPSHVDRICRIL